MGLTRVGRETRLPPQDLEAERAALSAMLQGTEPSREAVARALSDLKPEDFYRAAHQEVFRAVRLLFESGEKVDVITVCDQLRKGGTLEAAGGQAYVAGLLDELALTSNVEDYVRIIRAKATMRRLMDVGHALFGQAAEDVLAPDDLLNLASRKLYEIAQDRLQFGLQPLDRLMQGEIEKIETLASRGGGDEAMLTGLPTGFTWLDQLTSGLQDGELIVVAARPGMGKTSLALNSAEHVARERRVPVLVFSLEMSAESLARRILCAHARVNSHDVRRGRLYAEDRARLVHAAGVLYHLPIRIDPSSRLTPVQVLARSRRQFGELGAKGGLIIVDYLQLMDYSVDDVRGRPESRQQEITAISRAMKAVARELNVPVLVLSQLSRAPERREVSKPRLSDLRESGAIEQDADVVIFIYRDPKDNPPEGEGAGDFSGYNARISVAKQRNGPTGTFLLYFNRAYTRFDNLDTTQHQLLPEDE